MSNSVSIVGSKGSDRNCTRNHHSIWQSPHKAIHSISPTVENAEIDRSHFWIYWNVPEQTEWNFPRLSRNFNSRFPSSGVRHLCISAPEIVLMRLTGAVYTANDLRNRRRATSPRVVSTPTCPPRFLLPSRIFRKGKRKSKCVAPRYSTVLSRDVARTGRRMRRVCVVSIDHEIHLAISRGAFREITRISRFPTPLPSLSPGFSRRLSIVSISGFRK